MKLSAWLALGICALAANVLPVSPVAASVRPAGTVTVHGMHLARGIHLPAQHLPHLRPDVVVSSGNWSGYAVVPAAKQSFRHVAADFNIPSLNCANSTLGTSGDAIYSSWAGIDGFKDSTVEQIGIDAICDSSGTPTYLAFYEMFPLAPVLFAGVSPGDAIKVSVSHNLSAGTYGLSLTDVTTGGTLDTTQSCPAGSTCANASAELISEVTGGGPTLVDLPDFGMANYTAAAVTTTSGHRGTFSAGKLWSSSKIVMKDAGGTVMARPSQLYGGQAFNVAWQASS